MRLRKMNSGRLTVIAAVSAIGMIAMPALGDPLYWNGTGTGWDSTADWSTVQTSATPNPASVPGSGDIATFVAASATTAQIVSLNATQSALGLATNSSNIFLTTINSGGTTQILNLGGSGISHLGGALIIGSTSGTQQVNISLQGAQTWTSSTAGTNASGLVVNSNVSIGAGGNQLLTLTGTNVGSQINGSISDGSGTLSITKTSSGTWTFSAANTYSGATNISGGTLKGTDTRVYTDATNNIETLFGTGTIQPANGATLQLTALGNANATPQTFTLPNLFQVSASGASVTVNVNHSTGTGTNKTIAMGNASIGANDKVSVTGGSGYSLSFGQLMLGGGGTASTVTLNPTSANLILASVGNGSNTVSPTLTLDGTATANFINGTIANNGAISSGAGTAVTKSNASDWTLGGNNTYTGTTTVNGGILLINGTTSNQGNYSVTAGTLGGGVASTAGTIALANAGGGQLSVASSAQLQPGVATTNAPGILNITDPGTPAAAGTLAMASGSILKTVITGNTPGAGYGQVNVKGTVNITGVDLTASVSGYTPQTSDKFFILTNDGTDAITGMFAQVNGVALADNGDGTFSANDGTYNYTLTPTADSLTSNLAPNSGNDLALTISAVPEPASLALLALGATGLLIKRRR